MSIIKLVKRKNVHFDKITMFTGSLHITMNIKYEASPKLNQTAKNLKFHWFYYKTH